MKRIEQLSSWFEQLSAFDWNRPDTSEYIKVALYIKRLCVLACIICPEKMKSRVSDYYVGENGEIYASNGVIDIEEDIIYEYMASQSNVIDYLLIYYMKNPFWEIGFDNLAFDELDDESKMSLLDFCKKREGMFESRLISTLEVCEEDHPLKDYHNLFTEPDGCVADDCVILKSKLIPYFKRAEEHMEKENAALCTLINRCEKVLTRWLGGYSFSINEMVYENAYYFSCDDSGSWYEYGYGYGVLDHRLEIMIAGELIDRCILELDKKYLFLPDWVKEQQKKGKEEERHD